MIVKKICIPLFIMWNWFSKSKEQKEADTRKLAEYVSRYSNKRSTRSMSDSDSDRKHRSSRSHKIHKSHKYSESDSDLERRISHRDGHKRKSKHHKQRNDGLIRKLKEDLKRAEQESEQASESEMDTKSLTRHAEKAKLKYEEILKELAAALATNSARTTAKAATQVQLAQSVNAALGIAAVAAPQLTATIAPPTQAMLQSAAGAVLMPEQVSAEVQQRLLNKQAAMDAAAARAGMAHERNIVNNEAVMNSLGNIGHNVKGMGYGLYSLPASFVNTAGVGVHGVKAVGSRFLDYFRGGTRRHRRR